MNFKHKLSKRMAIIWAGALLACVESSRRHLKYSTGTQANGVLKWWVDGTLNGNYTNLKMVQDGGFDHLQFAPTYGGNTGDRKTEDDYHWYDHVRVSRGP